MRARTWLAPVLCAALAACGGGGGSAALGGTIEGSVSFRERILLPPGAVVEVQLEDISRADAPAAVLETVSLPAQPGPPYPFTLTYDPARIDARLRYALRATISVDDRLLFTTTEYIDPFTGSPVEISSTRSPGRRPDSPAGRRPATVNSVVGAVTLRGPFLRRSSCHSR